METYIVKKEENKLYLFKEQTKIGEISPDALSFVKEGDELDSTQVRSYFLYEEYFRDREPQFQTLTRIGHVEKPFKPKDETDIINQYIQIKGPCGHFH